MNKKAEKARRIVSGLLLCFVLISIGYAIGKEVTMRKMAGGRPPGGPATAPASGDKVIVYYMHRTVRCVTCNAIEKMAREAVENDFTGELKRGRVEWRTVNIDENGGLADRYNVASSTVVVVRIADGKEAGFQRLDEVWTLMKKPAQFAAYVSGAVQRYLDGGKP